MLRSIFVLGIFLSPILHAAENIATKFFTVDRFKNHVCFLNNVQSTDQGSILNEVNRQAAQSSAGGLIIYGAGEELTNNPENFGFQAETVLYMGNLSEDVTLNNLTSAAGSTVHYVRHAGTAPETILVNNQPHIRSGSAVVIVSHQGKKYAVLVKDKTKPILTVPGGTQTRQEDQLSFNLRYTAARELEEETGILLDGGTFTPLLSMEGSRPLMGMTNIPDLAYFYSHIMSSENSSVLQNIFSQNPTENGTYILQTPNNDEIEYIVLIPLPEEIEHANNNSLDEVIRLANLIPGQVNNTTVSFLHRMAIVQAFVHAFFEISPEQSLTLGVRIPTATYSFLPVDNYAQPNINILPVFFSILTVSAVPK